jgi:predicted ATPase/DNA-binding winged helix-turn-helix (wHTH) protein
MTGTYAFDRCQVRPTERQLLVDGQPAALGARAFDLLVALIERRDRVVTKAELFEAVWPGLVVEENNLQVQVSSLRKLLGPSAIATVAGRGYRFVAPLAQVTAEAPAAGFPAPRVHNLPQRRTRFIGREAALSHCGELLRSTRLLTLSGIGGCGKTRLAQELAQQQLAHFPDGVWFVDLGPLQNPQRVFETVAATLGIKNPGDEPLRDAAEHVRSRRTLVVLDNCEHVIDAAATSAEALLEAAGELKILVTSREALGMEGEQVFAVRSLSLPASAALADMQKSEAVRLFADHARLGLPDFEVTESNAAAISEICRRLDGIALAIELAAARVRVLSVDEIRARLDDRFRLLTGGSRAIPRHQTLQATMQWSHDHLTPGEQRLLRRLSVFAGGCTLAAASEVAGDSADEYDALERLTALHDKSLVLVDRDTRAQPRYRMLETVRQYAEERLNEAGEGDTIRTRHLEHFLELAERTAPGLRGDDPAGASAVLRAEQENLLAAYAWCSHAPGGKAAALRLTHAAWRYWKFTSQQRRGHALATAAVAAAGSDADPVDRCQAQIAQAHLALCIGRYDEVVEVGERCCALAAALAHASLVAQAHSVLAMGLHATGHAQAALGHYEAARDLARAQRLHGDLCTALNGVAEVHRGLGHLDTARAVYEELRDHARAHAVPLSLITTMGNLALLLVAIGQPQDARAALHESVTIAREVGVHGNLACALDGGAVIASALGEHARAMRWHGAAEARMHELGLRHEPVDEAFIAPCVAASRNALGEAASEAARSEGGGAPVDAVLADLHAWLART